MTSSSRRTVRPDPDALAALEERRDFLLRSLLDLDRELAAGDLDEADHRTLTADYTTRAAEVLRAIDDGQSALAAPRVPVSRGRRLLAVGGVAAVAVLAGVLVAQASGSRGSSGPTGLDVAAASSRTNDCLALEQGGEPDAALDCYSDILDSLPSNIPALTFRGWLQVREFEIDDGLADLDAAIQLDPEATSPYVFRASGRARSDDASGAVGDLASFYANDPSDEERTLADQFRPVVVEAALDECIGGEVTGAMTPVEVLACYRDVLDVDPDNPSASIYLGWLLARADQTDEARALLDSGLARDPTLTAGYVFRAAVLAHDGDLDAARSDLATFDESDPPEDQRAAAERVRAAIDAGEDPLPS